MIFRSLTIILVRRPYPDRPPSGGDGTITDARFDGHGCAISQASADLLLESIIGKPLEAVKSMSKQDILNMLGIDWGRYA